MIHAASDFVQRPLFLTCIYGTGVDTGDSISARLFIINHDFLNSGNYIHKSITRVSVVGSDYFTLNISISM